MAGRIVVALDGSEHAQAALRWAADEARLREATLVVLHAWTFVVPSTLGSPDLLAVSAGDLAGDLAAEQGAAARTLERALEGIGSDLTVETALIEGDPAESILQAAQDADLVVVGSRGRGGLRSALLGSVSQHVIQHAPCPVVVLRAHDEAPE